MSSRRKETKYIVVHRSKKFNNIQEVDISHRKIGLLRVGYHFFIMGDGTIQSGRPVYDIGAFDEDLNTTSVGICLGKEGRKEQEESLEALVYVLERIFNNIKIKEG